MNICRVLLLLCLATAITAAEKNVSNDYKVTLFNDRQMAISVTATANGKVLFQNRIFKNKPIEINVDPEANLVMHVYEGGRTATWPISSLKRMNPKGMAIKIISEGEYNEETDFKMDQNYYKLRT